MDDLEGHERGHEAEGERGVELKKRLDKTNGRKHDKQIKSAKK